MAEPVTPTVITAAIEWNVSAYLTALLRTSICLRYKLRYKFLTKDKRAMRETGQG